MNVYKFLTRFFFTKIMECTVPIPNNIMMNYFCYYPNFVVIYISLNNDFWTKCMCVLVVDLSRYNYISKGVQRDS